MSDLAGDHGGVDSYGLRKYPLHVGCWSVDSSVEDSSSCSGAVEPGVSSGMKKLWNSSVPGSEKVRSSSSWRLTSTVSPSSCSRGGCSSDGR